MRFRLLVLTLVLLLAACGGGARPSLSSLPVYSGATPIAEGQQEWADLMTNELRSVVRDKPNAEIQRYSLPADADWEAIKQFYSTQLSGTEWQPVTTYDLDNDTLNRRAWETSGGNQNFVVAYTLNSQDNNKYMLLGVFGR